MLRQAIVGPKRDWHGHKFVTNTQVATSSSEVLRPGSVLTTTGEFSRTGRFIGVNFVFKHKRGCGTVKYWIRVSDLLNPLLVRVCDRMQERQSAAAEAVRRIENLKPFPR